MKATGIVRRIDDLGRIVIPKEIRRVLRIRESDPLEIFTDHEGSIILRKYSPIGDMGSFAKPFAESLAQVSGHIALIADRDQCIAAAGSGNKQLLGKNLSKEMEEKMNARPPQREGHDARGRKQDRPLSAGRLRAGFPGGRLYGFQRHRHRHFRHPAYAGDRRKGAAPGRSGAADEGAAGLRNRQNRAN